MNSVKEEINESKNKFLFPLSLIDLNDNSQVIIEETLGDFNIYIN